MKYLALLALAACPAPRAPGPDHATRLVVLLVIDQLPEWAFEAKRPVLHRGFDRLLSEGEDAVFKKIGEEATETVLAAKGGDRLHLVRETADLWFHCMILLARHGLGPGDVLAELHRREGISGLDEKAARKHDQRR